MESLQAPAPSPVLVFPACCSQASDALLAATRARTIIAAVSPFDFQCQSFSG